MSSLLRTTAQIDGRLKYLLTVGGTNTDLYSPTTDSAVKSIMTLGEFTDIMTVSTQPAGLLLRDLGKTIMVMNANNQHIGLYRKVQAQLGYQAEGVPDDYNTATYYVRTWSADITTDLVTVSRIG